MELRSYLQAIRRRWKLVFIVALLTTGLAVLLVSQQDPVYESSGTFVVRPRQLVAGEVVAATDALNRGAEINSTYARIARSDVVKAQARQLVRDAGLPTSELAARSSVVPGTNILEIGAAGPEPDAVAAYAQALGQVTISYLDQIGEVFVLEELDTPEIPKEPGASKNELTVALALMLGLGVGSVLAFSIEYASEKVEPTAMNIRDAVTGAYTQDYFRLRLREEMSRCHLPPDLPVRAGIRKKGVAKTFTIASLSMHLGDASVNGSGPPLRPVDLRDAAQALQARLRVQDVLAYVGDQRFLLLCPDQSQRGTERILEEWNDYLGASSADHRGVELMHAEIQTCQCDSQGVFGDEESMRFAYAI